MLAPQRPGLRWPLDSVLRGGSATSRSQGLPRWALLGLQSQGCGLESQEQSKEQVEGEGTCVGDWLGKEGGDPPRHPMLC